MPEDAPKAHLPDEQQERRSATTPLFLGVVGAAIGLLIVLMLLDVYVLGWELALTGKGVSDALGSLAEVMAAVLGLSLTVVAIVVQLASSRYPAKIVDLFMTDPLNVLIFAFMASSCVYVVMVPVLAGDSTPMIAAITALAITVINFGLLLPYFGHVFAFLEPNNIITQIRSRATHNISALLDRDTPSAEEVERRQWHVANALERIADNSMAAIAQSDRNLAMHTVRTIEQLVSEYLPDKPRLPHTSWGNVPSEYLSTLAKEFLDEILSDMAWVEAKALMEYERIFRKALGEMNEVVSQIASSTRAIGEQALESEDDAALELTIQFFNTYMRHTLNSRNVRAAYNVLYEYRRFASGLLDHQPSACVKVVKHLVYYGRTANTMGLPFVTVTVAHDVRVLCQEAFDKSTLDMEEMLRLFLTLDQPSEDEGAEVALLGVRRAQSILGAFFLERGADVLAEQIRFDMREEPASRMRKIRDDILAVEERKFWEVTDRGFNFDWVSPDLRPRIVEFFEPMLKLAEQRASSAAV